MQTPKIILGAGKLGSQLVDLIELMNLSWKDVAFYDDAFPRLRVGPRNCPVLGSLSDGAERCIREMEPVSIALGSKYAAVRYALYVQLRDAGACLVNLIHPSCLVAPSATIGKNVNMMPGCVVGPRVSVGSLCWMYSSVTLEHDTQVEDNVTFGPSVVTSGFVKIGKHAFLGSGAVCIPEIQVGERALIGAGAVMIKDVPDGVVAAGVPARILREVSSGLDVPTLDDLSKLGVVI